MRPLLVPFDRILAPIPGGFRKENEYDSDGSGRDYAYDYMEIEEARRVVEVVRLRGDEADSMRQKAQPQPKAADWDKVFALGVAVLTTESKDLRVVAWVVEALGHLRGFGGLREGFILFRQLQGRYRGTSYPRDDDDPAVRRGPYEYLDGERILPLLIRRLPLILSETGEALSYLNCKEAERNEKRTTADERSDEPAGGGGLLLKDWQAAVESTSSADLRRLAGEVAACLIAFKAWERATDRLWRHSKFAPSLSRIGDALVDCAHEVQRMFPDPDHPEVAALTLALQRLASGRPPAAVEPRYDWTAAPVRDDPPVAMAPPRAERVADPDPVGAQPVSREPVGAEPAPSSTRAVPGEPAGPPQDVETAYRRVEEAAAFLRSVNPSDPVPYLLIRSLRLGAVFGMQADAIEEPHPGPPSGTRRELRRRAADGDWDEVVELTEAILARPEGRGWLDPHRMAIRGLEELGREPAALACRSLLAAVLDHAPHLAEGELDDGTPAASAETQVWLKESVHLPGSRDLPPPHEPTGEVVPLPPAAPAISAATALQDGQIEEAIEIFAATLDVASGDRARYLATVEFAEACLREGLDHLAIPLLEGLAGAADEALLKGWEGRSFFVGGATLLHDTLARDDGVGLDRRALAHARLASLAPVAGLRPRSR